ncbi:MAG: AMP-binding protein [Pseudomonadota bacterium]|uniref:AMP-binding protein n=1 Tax=Phenylobacterium sp. TaxID=1871053 RepID=UPI0025CCE583|nr:AMP-binding protein [Phenylobacterium sp.]MBT9471355.1 AMP-binding protein [Phenylobacterium sp.]
MSGSFYERLETYADAVALIDGGVEISYASLTRSAQQVSDQLGRDRQLVFLEARNDSASIAAYLGCLRGGHPVYLFGSQDAERAEGLAEHYRPNVILRVREDAVETEWRHRQTLALHPDLRVLLSTSGSTGSPKFVKLSERNIHSNTESIAEYLELTARDRAATSLSFNYSYGMSVVNSHLAVGASLLLTERSVSEHAFWDEFTAGGATSFAGVPYTFELLRRGGEAWARSPSLRYITQAGGRLSPEHVRHFAALGASSGWRFYVMYGQTEAAPRIAYLPPEYADAYPDCIGVAIPGGELSLLDPSGHPVLDAGPEGELAYRGPNVMMGYALATADLATDETPPLLLTGDIARRNEQGLYQIVGRTSRIVKPFGVRINLDELQEQVRALVPGAVCAGDDGRIVIACPPPASDAEIAELPSRLAVAYNLPVFLFHVRAVTEVPLLGNGKTDIQAVLALAPAAPAQGTGVGGDAGLFSRLARRAAVALGLSREESPAGWGSVGAIFEAFLEGRPIDDDSSFEALAGDSLSYVQTHLALEDYLGVVPDDWDQWSVADLERLRAGEAPRRDLAGRAKLKIQPTEASLLPSVRAFNARMEAGGSPWRFYDTEVPDWLAAQDGTATWRDYFLAVDGEDGAVRGGFILKQQPFLLDGDITLVGNTQGPVSEGIVDQRFGALGGVLLKEALARQPLQIGWGSSKRKAEVLAQAGWPSRQVPILLQIVNANAFLRRSGLLRRNAAIARGADLLAASGLGSFGNSLLQRLIGVSISATPRFLMTEEAEFGRWADSVWEGARGSYGLVAVRDAEALRTVMPAGQWPDAIPLKVEVEGAVVGWAALRDRTLSGDAFFGDLRVGSVIDILALPGHERTVAAAAAQRLRERGVDVIGTIVAHGSWIRAFRQAGFAVLHGRRNVSFSPALSREAGGFDALVQRAHLTLIDGDGPRIF